MLTRLCFNYAFFRLIMNCISTISFVVLINDSEFEFFSPERGLWQACLLSPLLFLLAAEGLSRIMSHEKSIGGYRGLQISHTLNISHFLFMDNILIFYDGFRRDLEKLDQGLNLLMTGAGMVLNKDKSSIGMSLMGPMIMQILLTYFPFLTNYIDDGLKYLGFHIKPNDCRLKDWAWMIANIERCID